MKISQEVREFARLNPTPSAGEGRLAQGASGERGIPAEVEAGMAEMSKRFHETGSELYVGAGGREHD